MPAAKEGAICDDEIAFHHFASRADRRALRCRRRRPIGRAARSTSSFRFRPAARPMSLRVSSAIICRTRSASKSWSRTSRAPTAISASKYAAKSAPDGYTILISTEAVSSNPHVYKMDFDPLQDAGPGDRAVAPAHRAGDASFARRHHARRIDGDGQAAAGHAVCDRKRGRLGAGHGRAVVRQDCRHQPHTGAVSRRRRGDQRSDCRAHPARLARHDAAHSALQGRQSQYTGAVDGDTIADAAEGADV